MSTELWRGVLLLGQKQSVQLLKHMPLVRCNYLKIQENRDLLL